MDDVDRATLASFRLLAAVARADGTISDGERAALEQALGERPQLLDALLTETIDVDAEIAALPDEASRERVYRSAFALAYVDDHMAHDEVSILERIWPDHPENGLLEEILHEVRDTLALSSIRPVADPARRAAEVEHDVLKYSIMAGVVGAMPLPFFGILADAAVVAIQVKMVRDIGLYWGHTLDATSARALMMGAAGGIGVQIAINNVARFVPGFGSVFAGGTSFASTFALGRVIDAYFAGDRDMSERYMRELFKKARQEGQVAYKQRAASIEATRKAHGPEIEQLAKKAADKEISSKEFEERVLDVIEPELETL